MARFIVIAHEAEFDQPTNGVHFVKFEPFKPILREQFEATKHAEIQSKLDEAADRLRGTGKSFIAAAIHVRNSGRKPAGFDKARLKVEHEAALPARSASTEIAA